MHYYKEIIYRKVNQQIQENKSKVVAKLNERQKDLLDIPDQIYVKNRQKICKIKKTQTILNKNKQLTNSKIFQVHRPLNKRDSQRTKHIFNHRSVAIKLGVGKL